jgi:hypothetical protein
MNLKQKVHHLLKTNPECRDNDFTLVSEIWNEECVELGYQLSEITALLLLHLSIEQRVSKQDSICRFRRDLNNKYEKTRGESYKPSRKEPNWGFKFRSYEDQKKMEAENATKVKKSHHNTPPYSYHAERAAPHFLKTE